MVALEPLPDWTKARLLSEIPSQHYSLSREKRQLLFWCAAAAPKDPLFVEIGVCHGGTAMMLAYIANCKGGRYVGVDNWSLEGSHDAVRRHLDTAGMEEPIATLVLGDSTKLNPVEVLAVTGTWESGKEYKVPARGIDLLLIDGGHQIGVVDQDCKVWIPHVKPGGLIAFDDYTGKKLPREEDCHWAVRESVEQWALGYEMVGYWSGLLVVRVPG